MKRIVKVFLVLIGVVFLLGLPSSMADAKLKAGTTGEDIVAMAKKHKGMKYDTGAGGGSTWEKGDCSGFVWLVYREFDPSTTYVQSGAWNTFAPKNGFRKVSGVESESNGRGGTKVKNSSLNLLKLGDVIQWDGHVGIYIGNGQMISATGYPRDGVPCAIGKCSSSHSFGAVWRRKGLKYGSTTSASGSSSGKETVIGSDGSWCKVTINQTGVGHGSGCTVVSMQLLLQNSKQLKKHQLSGAQTSATKDYKAFDKDCEGAGFQNGDQWVTGKFASGASNLCKSKWSSSASLKDSKKNATTKDYHGATAVVGFGNKDFKDMTHAEQATAMKAFWNSGYYCIFCVEYKGVGQKSNGVDGYKAAHATMLAGVKGSEIYLNDPAVGKVCKYSERSAKGGAYNLMYILPFKNEGSSPLEYGGGASEITKTDTKSAEKLGVSTVALSGAYTESQLSAYTKLKEVSIQTKYLDGAQRGVLSQDDTTNLDNWEMTANEDKGAWSFVKVLRIFTQIIGILFIMYVLLIYVAYWFDRLNVYFDFELLGTLTLGRLHISESEDKCTFGIRTVNDLSSRMTVNHKAILFICIVGLLFGLSIVSGLFYSILTAFVNGIISIFS